MLCGLSKEYQLNIMLSGAITNELANVVKSPLIEIMVVSLFVMNLVGLERLSYCGIFGLKFAS